MAFINPMSGAMIPAMMGAMAPFTKNPLAAAVTALSFNGVNAYLSHQPLVAAGDFEVETLMLYAGDGDSGWQTICGGDLSFLSLGIREGNQAKATKNGTFDLATSGLQVPIDAISLVAYKFRLKGDGNYAITYTVNGVSSSEFDTPLVPAEVKFDRIARWATHSYLDAKLFYINYKSGFTDTAGNPLNPLYYPGKNPELPYVPNERAVLGGELAPSGIHTLATAAGGVVSYITGVTATANTTYLINIEYTDIVGGTSFRVGSGANEVLSPVLTGSGAYAGVITALNAAEFEFVGRGSGVTSGNVQVSIKEASGYATKNGTAPDGSDHESYTKMADGRLLGDSLVSGDVIIAPSQTYNVVPASSELNANYLLRYSGAPNSDLRWHVSQGIPELLVGDTEANTNTYGGLNLYNAGTESITIPAGSLSIHRVLSYAPGANT